jgi:A/G-specific adenine glycosylase
MISYKLEQWYLENKRSLPWRDTKDPYLIWISEIILQQTRVVQGYAYYLRFIEAFPDVNSLAKADENDVLVIWQGLGYYSRARNIHFTAKTIVDKYNGIFPTDYNEILKLKGIGEYTAAAIASFAYNKPHAVVDGNVYRFLSRLFGIDTPIDTSTGKKEITSLANHLLDQKEPGLYNQAIMEFGALHCTPDNPMCETCPFNDNCIAYSKNLIKRLPVKQGKIKTKDRFFYYLDIRYGDKSSIQLKKRIQKDIWQNLYELPLIETQQKTEIDELIEKNEFKEIVKISNNLDVKFIDKSIKHVLSHQTIHATFLKIVVSEKSDILDKKLTEVKLTDLYKYPISRLVDRYFEQMNAQSETK